MSYIFYVKPVNKIIPELEVEKANLNPQARSDMLANITTKSFDQEKLFETRELINLLVT